MTVSFTEVLDLARTRFGGTKAEFDYSVAVGGTVALRSLIQPGSSHTPGGDARREIDNATYEMANRDLPEVVPGADNRLDERQSRAAALRERLAEDLDRYAAECRARKYTGWSQYSTKPIE